ncbi:MAG: Pyridoxal-dependent decarboxylase domain protein [Candidatus Jorgensenbacteria bacterium GW2011_GWA2_45_13]|uniref:Pyridoxal-dependent decarboxylase domain protein n=1 Tax=Candidatus Jorgensenbacteria bacterium GW2011_GWA2_45_13 TaxID=1618662 RepID=A0A0G1L641_9BACT|nr:MAG: Pyridoxal-dependent decarboxylase domain protein [Candidatus Jorgensenbacteria bacterium GW2011_GWA2_45_13]
MIRMPHTIKELFYNPRSDSIYDLVRSIKKTHREILKKTELRKVNVASKLVSDEVAIHNFSIPENSLQKRFFPSLISDLFQGVSRWHSPRTMYNIAPPPILPTVVTKAMTSLYNPNLALHTASGKSLLTEQKVIKAIAEYIGWDREKAGGIFTWGGKATTMYGIKLGLYNCSPHSATQGVKEDVIVLSTASGHPSHISDVEWLGIGTANIIRLDTDKNTRVNLKEMERVMKEAVKMGKKIAAIIISGGTTNDMVVDPIAQAVNLRDRLVQELKLSYTPHVHVDAVVAFPWIFFKSYDFKQNALDIDTKALERLLKIIKNLRGLYRADSFGVDFHKMGFCPYVSSVFMVKDGKTLTNNKGDYHWPFLYSMENSRAADGPNTAYVVLNALGVRGFQYLIGHLTEITLHLQYELEKTQAFDLLNKTSLGTAIMFIPRLPKKITFANPQEEITVRNLYTTTFIDKLAKLGNPYYVDKIPSYSTGSKMYPYTSLKAYMMSPYSNKKSNVEFVSFMVKLKKEIDSRFNFANNQYIPSDMESPHPLKGTNLRV